MAKNFFPIENSHFNYSNVLIFAHTFFILPWPVLVSKLIYPNLPESLQATSVILAILFYPITLFLIFRKFHYEIPADEIKMYSFAKQNNLDFAIKCSCAGKKGRIFSEETGEINVAFRGRGELSVLEFGQYIDKRKNSGEEYQNIIFYTERELPFEVQN